MRSLGFGVVTIMCAATIVAGAMAKGKEQPPKPTGACTVTVSGKATCTSKKTKDECNDDAKKAGGKADWKEGLSCFTKEPPKATGACTITVIGILPTCTSAMPRDACDKAAAKVGGMAEWKEGEKCPGKK